MPLPRWTFLAGVVALSTACTANATQVVTLSEPPPAEAPAGFSPEVPPEPVAAAEVPAASAPAPAPALAPVSDDDDNPLLEGLGDEFAPTGATPGTASTGGVRAVAATAAAPTPTGRIEIPAIGLNHLTYEGIDLAIINYGPSHWPGKPLPGELGNTVFPGHRTTFSRPFWDLDKLVPGNEVIFTTPAGRFTYRVTGTTIVGARDTWVVNNTPDATFTLLACHPKGSAKQRIVVKGRMVVQPAMAPPPPPPPAFTPAAPAAPLTPPTMTPRRGLLGLF